MGMSASAILFYGFELDEDLQYDMLPESESDFGGWIEDTVRDALAAQEGLVEPPSFDWSQAREPGNIPYEELQRMRSEQSRMYKEWADSGEGAHYRAYTNRCGELYSELGVEVDYHGHIDYDPRPFIHVKSYSVSLGDSITDFDMSVPGKALEKLSKFCELSGLPMGEPKWHLCADFG